MRLAASFLFVCLVAQAEDRPLTAIEKRFQESLSNVTLSGTFVEDGINEVSEDRYVIERVTKASGDTWKFHVRFEYNQREMKFTLPAEVKWAGETPVIVLTNFPLPGAGMIDARIVLSNSRYAGTWMGKKHGGKMFGNVIKN